MEKKDTIYDLVKFARETGYEKLPEDTIWYAKMLLADILACAASGTTADGSQAVADLVLDWGGKEQASVLVYDRKVPTHHAAYLNSLLSHCRDYDEFQPDAVVHTGVSVIPTALAVAEAEGNVDGKKLLAAIVKAVDVFVRWGFSVKAPIDETGWIYSPTLGHFASALTASMLMDLDEETTVNALGIVYAQVAGNQQTSADTSLTKGMQPAFACRSGVMSAELARAGITGARNIIDGRYNYYRVYVHDRCDRSVLTDKLGEEFYIGRLSYKFYPVCGMCQGSIGSTMRLIEEHDIKPEEVISVKIGTSAQAIDSCVEPKAVKYDPQTPVDARFSIPFSVATILAKRRCGLNELSQEGIHDPVMRSLINKIEISVDEDIEKNFSRGVPPAVVTIETTRGTWTANAPQKGHPENPAAWKDIRDKFMEAVKLSVYPVKEGEPEKVLDMIENLESLSDVSELIRAFNGMFLREASV